MDKKSAPVSAQEAKLEELSAKIGAPKEGAHEAAKKAFDEALKKTAEESKVKEPEETVVVESKKPEPKKPDSSKELERLKKELAEAKSKLQEKETPPKKEEPKTSDFDAVQAELAEQFGEEEGEILAKSLRALLEPREARISHLEKLIEKAVEQSKVQSAKSNRSRLAKDYPHLEDSDDAWDVISAQAQTAFASGKYETSEEAFDSVALALYGEPKKRAEIEAEEEASRIAASTPTQPSSAKRERKLSMEQKSFEVFKHLLKNPQDKAGAAAIAHRLRID